MDSDVLFPFIPCWYGPALWGFLEIQSTDIHPLATKTRCICNTKMPTGVYPRQIVKQWLQRSAFKGVGEWVCVWCVPTSKRKHFLRKRETPAQLAILLKKSLNVRDPTTMPMTPGYTGNGIIEQVMGMVQDPVSQWVTNSQHTQYQTCKFVSTTVYCACPPTDRVFPSPKSAEPVPTTSQRQSL